MSNLRKTQLKPWLDDGDLQIHVGDCREVLKGLPDESVHCVVTSPPYWGLRDYQVEGQLGLERSHHEYVANMVTVFQEVRRVLRSDGTCWLNLGDSYTADHAQSRKGKERGLHKTIAGADGAREGRAPTGGLKPKDLAGIPWRVALALQDDGWWLRSDIIWEKTNPMPESAKDRPTKSHEYVFMLTKSGRYFYDQQAIMEPAEWSRWGKQTNHKHEGGESAASWIKPKTKKQLQERGRGLNPDRGDNGRGGFYDETGVRNARSVWRINTESYAGAHFATFPQELPRRCIKAGTSEKGCCPECGSPWERIVETDNKWTHDGQDTRGFPVEGRTGNPQSSESLHRNKGGVYSTAVFKGWRPSCDHDRQPVPCVVMDPFGGSGTTGKVARDLGRKSILVELSEAYAGMMAERLQQLSLIG